MAALISLLFLRYPANDDGPVHPLLGKKEEESIQVVDDEALYAL